jgi:uncharacterized protein YjbI with pentapeptide repeats/stress response protein SCP2
MTIELTKGDRFNLSKEAPDFNKIAIALGWQVSQTSQNYDIDASVFMLGADGRIPDEKYFVFYNNLTSPDGAVRHSGDNTTGQIEGDDETVFVDLSLIDAAVEEVVFVVTIHEGQVNNQNFSQVRNSFIRLYNLETGSELVRYNLKEVFSQETALEFGRLYRKNGEWRFQAVGQGYNAGLQSFVDKYHVENKVKSTENVAQKLDDAEILRRFSDRVDKQLQEAAAGESVANPVTADNVEPDLNVDDSVSEIQEPAITAEEFLKRYNKGERDFTGINLAGVNLSGKSLTNVNLSRANLSGAELSEANLSVANLSEANLCHANLHTANLSSANLGKAQFINANLSEVNLQGSNLSEANLSGVNLSSVHFVSGTNFTKANLSKANLTGLNLRESKLMKADLSNANLSDTNLLMANLEGANLEGSKLQQALYNAQTVFPRGFDPVKAGAYLIAPNVSLKEANLARRNLSRVNLSEANLSGANLTKENLQGAQLLQANLNKTNLSEADMRSANLTAASLIGANLMQANLGSANLTAADLSGANLKNTETGGANFSGANLTKVNLVGGTLQCNVSGAILTEGNLCGANLRYGNFTGADLTSADLRGANLDNTNLEKANLKGANLSGVVNMASAKLTGAIMPDGTTHE